MIVAQSVAKSFGSTTALSGLSFTAGPGTVTGLLGPNGAGKTTLMRILCGFLSPDSGSASICGIDIRADPVGAKRMIGYLPETFPVYPEMRVSDYLRFVAGMRGLSSTRLRNAIEGALQSCGIEDARSRLLGALSRGYRQRVGLAQAILHDPPVLILDEPTSGLDPIQTSGIRELIRALGRTKSVLFSTHILPEAQAICSGILVLSGGKLVGESSAGLPGLLRDRDDSPAGEAMPGILSLRIKSARTGLGPAGNGVSSPHPSLERIASELAELPGIQRVLTAREDAGIYSFELGLVRIRNTGGKDSQDFSPGSPALDPAEVLAMWAASSGWLILGLSFQTPSLEEVFAGLTGKSDVRRDGKRP